MTWYQLNNERVGEEIELRHLHLDVYPRRLPEHDAQLKIGPAPSEEDALVSLVDEHELMSLVYSKMIASLEDKKETSLGWEKLVAQRKTAEMARLLRDSEAQARAKTVAKARARAEVAAAGMLRAAARVRAATEESAVRAEASRAQEGRAQEKERLAAEARAKAYQKMVAANVARLGVEKQRAEKQKAAVAAAAKARAMAAEAKQAEAEARANFRLSRSVEAAAAAAADAEAEARAERLTRKFAHEAKAAADDALTRNMLSPCSGSGSSRRTNHRRARPTIRVTPCRCASCLLLQVCGIEPCPIGVESWSRVCVC